jgi:ABC-type transporter Mla MlaB component
MLKNSAACTVEATATGLALVGEINFANVMQLRAEAMKILLDKCQGTTTITLDFSRLVRVDSSVLSLLLVWGRWALAVKCQLRCVAMPSTMLALAKFHGFSASQELSTVLDIGQC